MKAAATVSVLVLLLAAALHSLDAAVNCSQVDGALAPCIGYLRSGGTPLDPCCNGVRRIQALAQSTEDRQAACECLKAVASQDPAIKDDAASSLPQKCGVPTSVPISKPPAAKTSSEGDGRLDHGIRLGGAVI